MPAADVSTLMSSPNHTWQQALQQAITQPAELLDVLDLPTSLLPQAEAAAKTFRLKVPRGFVARMRSGDLNDPLLKQVLPLGEELVNTAGFSSDPVGDALAKSEAGIIHKYNQRALLISTGACAVHCRYCFRRHFPYDNEQAAGNRWHHTLQWLQKNTDISEVILSGGDPLSLSDGKLQPLMEGLTQLEHVTTLRLHSRQPIVLPERITENLIHTLQLANKKLVVVVHSNHANELDHNVEKALWTLKQAGATLLNQAVLLKGVNDHASTLAALSRRLFDMNVLPYYLHLLDSVQGAAHFDTPADAAVKIHQELSALLPGYLVPRLVKEIPGEPNKTIIN